MPVLERPTSWSEISTAGLDPSLLLEANDPISRAMLRALFPDLDDLEGLIDPFTPYSFNAIPGMKSRKRATRASR
jgi:hypothetical protein